MGQEFSLFVNCLVKKYSSLLHNPYHLLRTKYNTTLFKFVLVLLFWSSKPLLQGKCHVVYITKHLTWTIVRECLLILQNLKSPEIKLFSSSLCTASVVHRTAQNRMNSNEFWFNQGAKSNGISVLKFSHVGITITQALVKLC